MKAITPQEMSILKLIGEGNTSRRIAEQLHLSIYTVQSYRRNLLKKFGAVNSAELVRNALHHNDLMNNRLDGV